MRKIRKASLPIAMMLASAILVPAAVNAQESPTPQKTEAADTMSNEAKVEKASPEDKAKAKEVIDTYKNNAKPSSGKADKASDGGVLEEVKEKTTDLYRGSPLMWSKERVEFRYDGTKVLNSSGWQEGGAIFPNTMTKNGTVRTLETDSEHQWRGTYTAGAGVPTPWGNANAYSMDATAKTNVRHDGSYDAKWLD